MPGAAPASFLKVVVSSLPKTVCPSEAELRRLIGSVLRPAVLTSPAVSFGAVRGHVGLKQVYGNVEERHGSRMMASDPS